MGRKEDAPSKRLTKWIDIRRKHKDLRIVETLIPYLGENYSSRRSNLNDPVQRRYKADLALRLRKREPSDEPIRAAFKAFDLDPRDPLHWRRLLFYLADCHFGQRDVRRGAPRRWNDERRCQLLLDFAIVQSRHPGQTDTAVSGFLQRDKSFGARYAEIVIGNYSTEPD